MDSLDELIAEAKNRDTEALDYVINEFTGYTRFEDYSEFEAYAEEQSEDTAVTEKTVFDEYGEMLAFARQEWAAKEWIKQFE